METPHSILKKFFGYDSFRPGQEQIVQRLLAGQDVLAVMPRFTACALSGFTAEETHDFEQFYYRIAQNISLCLQKEGTLHE